MKKNVALAAWAVVCASGCIESALNPDAGVALTGSALNEDKSPLAGADLKFQRSDNSACVLTPDYATLHTGTNGSFTQKLVGSDTQNGDIARCFRLALPDGAGGGGASATFLIQVTQVQVPVLQRWSGEPSASASAAGVSLSYRDLSQSHGLGGLTYGATVQNADGVVWTGAGVSSPWSLSGYLLEDFSGASAQLFAHNDVKGSGTTFGFDYVSDRAALPQGQDVPFSRGVSCAWANGPVTGACPLTDGKVAPVALGPNGNGTTGVQLTLGASQRTPKHAVLRNFTYGGSASSVVVEGSADGASWTLLGTVPAGPSTVGTFVDLPLTATAPVAFVRVRGKNQDGTDLTLTGLAEFSVFDH